MDAPNQSHVNASTEKERYMKLYKIAGVGVVLLLLTGVCVSAAETFMVLRVSTPLVASGSAGIRFGDPRDGLQTAIQAEAGVGGGKLALGFDGTGQGGFGYGIKAAFLRTWFEPIDVDEDQNFIGIEGEISIKRLILNLGGYGRVGDGDDDWMVSAGVGFIL
jgi:hypothetical protein